eukprot:1983123-Prorocentrum_lima.AAC.1
MSGRARPCMHQLAWVGEWLPPRKCTRRQCPCVCPEQRSPTSQGGRASCGLPGAHRPPLIDAPEDKGAARDR